MPKTTILYGCLICGKQYFHSKEAVACETQPPEPRRVKVGDIVVGQPIFGWFDGDKAWVASGLSKKCEMAFYYVVTHIDGSEDDGHRVRYHLFTKAMAGDHGYRSGWTFNSGHITIKKHDGAPAKVLEDSKDLIGQKAKRLL